ncbi:MAG: RimK family alpha-L-glutamate ligase [Candidatus Lokiarchaeota archaeon]|nr:RimK family alpha-L-glutamate ligase [Candidatus Lokiarchaeota archaeon]MBD3198667.1 RimK family alpha-L-glutamate ligase [Candidatus Lokiarchaeota archaeon]
MKVGIMLNRVTWEIKQLINEFKIKNISYSLLNNQKVFFRLSKNKDAFKEDFDVILERSLSYMRGLFTSRILELKGYEVINSFDCLNITGNKLLTTIRLIEEDIRTPVTDIAFTKDSALKSIMNDLGFPVVIKPIIGSWGRLISKLDDYNTASGNLECREIMGNILQKIYYIQNYVETKNEDINFPIDIRVIVIGEDAVAAMGRFSPEKDFRSNIAIGGRAKEIKLTEEIKKVSIRATKAVKGEIVGVDLIYENGDLSVLEVNGTPQFKGITEATKANISEYIANYISEKYS